MVLASLWARLRSRSTASAAAAAAAGAAGGASRNWRQTFWGQFSRNMVGIITWVPVAIWFNTSVAEVTMINGPSMYPFLNGNYNESTLRDVVLNYKLYAQDRIGRGMIVFLRSPVHPEVVSVKRVIALEGDVVETKPPCPTPYVRIPQGHIWVEGDAGLGRSLDSNTYGPVSVGLVTGELTHILFPFSKAGRVRWWENPPDSRIATAP